jgi:hypothetical protein
MGAPAETVQASAARSIVFYKGASMTDTKMAEADQEAHSTARREYARLIAKPVHSAEEQKQFIAAANALGVTDEELNTDLAHASRMEAEQRTKAITMAALKRR